MHTLLSLRLLLTGFTASLLASCIHPSPIANRDQTFKRPLVVSTLGNSVLVQKIGITAFDGGMYEVPVPEWKIDDKIESLVVQQLKQHGIQAQAGGSAARSQTFAVASYREGNSLGLKGINEGKLKDAAVQVSSPGADSVLFISSGFQSLPTGGVSLVGGYGMCTVGVGGIGSTYVFSPLRGFAFSRPEGKPLGTALSRNVGLKNVSISQLWFARPWSKIPPPQQALLMTTVESAIRDNLPQIMTQLGF